jgi:tripartite-type tricarboxylate transporter receptor subunit TctC
MNFPRRKFLHLAAGAVALPIVTRGATAQTYPTRPITMVVPLPAGGTTDVIARVVAERMGKYLGRSVIIENIGGAEGSIGLGRVARAKPDGYTIDLASMGPHVLNGALFSLQYDVLNAFVPIAPIITTPALLFGRKTLASSDLMELMDWLKANPNRVSVAVSSASFHLVIALFQRETRTQLNLVPYRGDGPAVQDLVAGHIDLAFSTPDKLPLARTGNLKVYAATSEARLAAAPDVPTFNEMRLPAVTYEAWFGLFAPKGTPPDVVGKLNAATVDAMVDPAIRSRIAELGFEVFPREQQSMEALDAMVKAGAAKWWPLIKELGIKAE